MPDKEKLFVRRVGEGEPVLVLSGLGMQSWQWLPFYFPIAINMNLLSQIGEDSAALKIVEFHQWMLSQAIEMM